MKNINTFENFDNAYNYVKVPDDRIVIDFDIPVEDDFPVKNHSSAARRRKTYLKGKHRYELLRQKDKLPPSKKDSVLRGMARKTCIFHVPKSWKIKHDLRINRSTVRRQWGADDKMNEYAMEV